MAKGFTLLETLITIAIIAALSGLLILILNPAETLRKTRDSQRLSDLRAFKTALAYLITTKTNIQGSDLCGGGDVKPQIYISFPKDKKGVDIPEGQCPTPLPPPGSPLSDFIPNWQQTLTNNLYRIDGMGWLPVNFTNISGGTPISFLPVDPVNLINVPSDIEGDNCPDDNDFIYRYTCFKPALSYEIDAMLESKEFTVNNAKATQDGGTNMVRYEVGTALNLLP